MVGLLQVEKPMRSGAPALGYNRYGQEQFGAPGEAWCESIKQSSLSLPLSATGEFQIDTTGTYHGMNIKKMAVSTDLLHYIQHIKYTHLLQEVAAKPRPQPEVTKQPDILRNGKQFYACWMQL